MTPLPRPAFDTGPEILARPVSQTRIFAAQQWHWMHRDHAAGSIPGWRRQLLGRLEFIDALIYSGGAPEIIRCKRRAGGVADVQNQRLHPRRSYRS